MMRRVKVRIGHRWYVVEIDDLASSPIIARVDGVEMEIDLDLLPSVDEDTPSEDLSDSRLVTSLPQPIGAEGPVADRSRSAIKAFHTPMAGLIVSVAVKLGDQVVTGDEICVLEAMKMRQVLRAEWSGIVKAVFVHSGTQVKDGDVIMELD